MKLNTNNIIKNVSSYNPSHIIIGYSGGGDSSALLHIFKNYNKPVIAIYINHNVHKDAKYWQEHCQKVCLNYNIEFLFHKLDAKPTGESFEAWASQQRMQYFKAKMSKYDNPILLLGQHCDDQAETFLLQAIRGAGLAGLAAMPEVKELEHGYVIRPLLDYSKKDIIEYANENNILHIFDDSNLDSKYKRNLIRNEVMPILEQISPSINKTLSRSAQICAKSNRILSNLLTKEISRISKANNINIEALKDYDTEIQESIIHLWFKQSSNTSLKQKQLNSIITAINDSATTGWQLNISKEIFLKIEYGQLIIKTLEQNIHQDNITQIKQWLINNKIDTNTQSITIRERKSTDRCRYLGRAKNNSLKTLFQELKIPASEREKTRIVEANGKIVAIYPFFICD